MFFFKTMRRFPQKAFFSFSTNHNYFYPKKLPVFINGKLQITSLPIDLMRKVLMRITILQGSLLFGTSLYIIMKYKSANKFKLAAAFTLSIISFAYFVRGFSRKTHLIFKIDLAEDGKNIYIASVNRLFKFKEQKIPIDNIKPLLEKRVPEKYYKLGKPIMINNEIYLLPKERKGNEVEEDKKELFEAILKGQYIFIGEDKINTDEISY